MVGLFLVLVGLNFIDLVTTYIILGLGGREFNPIGAWLLKHGGFVNLIWLKILVLSYLAAKLPVLAEGGIFVLWVMLGFIIFYVGIVAWNFYAISRLQKMPRRKKVKVEFEDPLLPI